MPGIALDKQEFAHRNDSALETIELKKIRESETFSVAFRKATVTVALLNRSRSIRSKENQAELVRVKEYEDRTDTSEVIHHVVCLVLVIGKGHRPL